MNTSLHSVRAWKSISMLTLLLLGIYTIGHSETYKFELHCPHDVWIDCDDQIYDLDAYGIAYVHEDYDTYPAPEPEVHYHLDDCGGGYIKRKWQVADNYGRWHKCFQYIHVGTGGNFDEHDITWPHDYWLDGCFENTDPEDLPYGFDRPRFHEEECSQVFYSYKDWVFTPQDGGSCGKILREWKVIDWCVYDPNDYHPKGIWTNTQVIKIKGSSDFSIDCPNESVFDAGAECIANVSLAPVVVSGECPEGVKVTNDSPYAYDNGPDASGDYPVGKTFVCYTATDGCGHEAKCCTWITVMDNKKPTPICFSGIVLTLGMHYDGYYRVCGPDVLDKGSFDNCTPQEDLIIWSEPDTFTCADLGETPVTMYVQDASGNVSFCETYFIVQDNMGMCPPGDSLTINGNVHTMARSSVANVAIKNMDTESEVMTDEEGMWRISELLQDEDYRVTAVKTDEVKEGLDMEDLVVMSGHLFGEDPITDPYLLIAADVDNNHDIDLQDFLNLRGLIVGDFETFEEFGTQKAWRLIDDRYSFPDPTEPWDYREEKMFRELESSMHNQNFIGVKIGDLDMSYGVDGVLENEEITGFRSDAEISLRLQDRYVRAGETISLEIAHSDMSSWQLADIRMTLAGAVLTEESDRVELLTRVDGRDLQVLAVQTDASMETIVISLTAKRDAWLSQLVSFGEGTVLTADDRSDLKVAFDGSSYEVNLLQNTPNPFVDETMVQFTLPRATSYTLEVMNTDGQVVYAIQAQGQKGSNQVVIRKEDLRQNGVYMIQLTSDDQTVSKKMILTE